MKAVFYNCSLTALCLFTEVEKFIKANTKELAKDKWLCPLSGKKFKGPEFVRKHIFNKHGDKVEAVKKEVGLTLTVPRLPNLIDLLHVCMPF